MKLKRLTLQGYKTFASKTEFIFDGGITTIVGPNGSGKSNIADALRWVLGEQSYSTLRGRRTADMIFNGSHRRPRAGMAQAILTLDNTDGWLPIDYSEVEIGRRAFRSGENEYLINGQKVRLKDVTELLATSGLAERTYTIIGQGLVDQALSLRAEERRSLFEEAAGINQYKAKRAQTLRRLEETRRNLERVHDILAEIRPRLTSLKRQATRARNYEQIAADLRHLLRIWYGYRWEQAKEEVRLARQRAAATESAWREHRRQLLAQQEKIEERRRHIHRLRRQIGEAQAARDDLRDKLETARRRAAILGERQESIKRQLIELAAEQPALEKQQAAAREQMEQAMLELQSAQQQLADCQTQLQAFNSSFGAQENEIRRWEETVRRTESQLEETRTEVARLQGRLNELQQRLAEPAPEEDTSQADELQQATLQAKQRTAALEVTRQELNDLRRQQAETQQKRQALAAELQRQRQALRDAEKGLGRQRNAVSRLEAQVELLGRLRQREVEMGGGVEVIGRLASLIAIPEAYQTPIEAALAARLGVLVVADEEQLWQLLNSADQNHALIAAALSDIQPFPSPDVPEHPGVIGWASDLFASEQSLRPLVQLLLGRVLLVRDRETAVPVSRTLPAGAVAVTLDGLVAHAGGLVELTGGDREQNILAREQEWRATLAEKEETAAAAEKMEAAVAQQQAQLNEQEEQWQHLLAEENRLRRLERDAAKRAEQAQRELDRVEQRHAFLERQQRAREAEAKKLAMRAEETSQAMARQQSEAVRLEAAVVHARAQLEALPVAEARQHRESLQQSISSAQTIVAGRQAVVDSRRATLNQIDQQIGRVRERIAALQREQQALQLDEAQAEVQQLQQRLAQLDEERAPLRQRLSTQQQAVTKLEEEAAAIQRRTHERETHYTQTQITLSQQQSQLEALQERIKADLGIVALSYDEDQTGPTPLPMGEVVERLPLVEQLPEDIEESIQHARGQLQRMGAVNPEAPVEYEETLERFEFLTQQVEDLNQTEVQLRQVIAELDELTSTAFADTVEKVNAVFGDIFKRLFGGGSARLALTDPDDLINSGVDIVARLPNKREQGLAVLSGGERSLTAAALVFSLLKVSPTPFCVLDEVDAALDEANVNRFRDLLRELSRQTQFIIITHNRGTVQAAQTVYGISMGADSASQAISIKPEDYVGQPSLI
ncbi:MAG: chromosome segregation protein SMC [Anaerolineae bacterium]